ncbi:hypothetical protein QR680_006121 [Steinernema hermaphroditum]|uniref:Uncharacterized protein n=1 Tax=Steinernema hermaphroditum TaxID=289476 RepID=A0AA39HUG3_9BILA|nr:hypothetical protein QR680_006121 [Steinernema hermaphroditum]
MKSFTSLLIFSALLALANPNEWGSCQPTCPSGQICVAYPCQAKPCLGYCTPDKGTGTTTRSPGPVPFKCDPPCRGGQTCIGTNCQTSPCFGVCAPFGK